MVYWQAGCIELLLCVSGLRNPASALDRRDGPVYDFCSIDQRLKSSNMAIESRARCAGTRFFCAHVDCMDDQSHFTFDCGYACGLYPRTGDARAERPFFIIWLAHSSGTWGWHGTPDMLQLPRRDPSWVGGIFYSSNSACRGYPARSRYDDHCQDSLIPSVPSHF